MGDYYKYPRAEEGGNTGQNSQFSFPASRNESPKSDGKMVVVQREDQEQDGCDRISQDAILLGSGEEECQDDRSSCDRICPGNTEQEVGRILQDTPLRNTPEIAQDANGRIVNGTLFTDDNQPSRENAYNIRHSNNLQDKRFSLTETQNCRVSQGGRPQRDDATLQDKTILLPVKATELTFELNGGVTESNTQLLEKRDGQTGEGEEEEEDRQTWDKKLDFLLAIIGFAIDLGNVWRFPYICYKNGGGAFLIPYLTMLVFLGLPLFYMELALGQFHRQGPITIWRRICPMFCGVGYAICVVASFVGAYYNTIIAWALYYLIMSLRSPLVYASCDNDWNTPQCAAPGDGANRTNTSVSSVAEFFNNHVLEAHKSSGIGDLGPVRWQLFLCLVVVFIVIFFCCWKGTKSTGKTSLALLRWRDAVLTSSVNCCTSFLAGIVVFAVLGYMAHMQGTTVEAVATHGPGLVFVVYAEAISTLGGSVFWAIIFFLMLIALGLDSTFGGLEGVMTALADEFTIFRNRRTLVVAVVCGYCFLTGLPTVTYGGTYFIYLMDTHAAPISLLFICFVEVIAVNWFYGARRFADDIKSMIGTRPSIFWLVCWSAVCPLGLLILFSLSFVGYERLSLDGYIYPGWAELVGWLVTLASIVCIPGYAAWSFFTSHGSIRQ
ncbi:hypothetical protein BaRGS_00028781, partial [Batillaria attramentaria]